MKRRDTLLALVAFGASPLASVAQLSPKVARIGYLGNELNPITASFLDALRAGLRDLGYVEGKNMIMEVRWSEGRNERFADLAVELVRLNVDVIVAEGTPPTLSAKRTTKTIPIVMTTAGDPVATGLVASLARPGGNVTGSAILSSELMVKRFELLVEALPLARRLAVLLNPTNPVQRISVEAMESAAARSKVTVRRFEIRSRGEFEHVFAAIAKERFDAVAITQDGVFVRHAGVMADLANKHRLASIGFGDYAKAGGLLGYGANILELNRRAAYFVDRILKGTKPGDLPVEQATKFELFVNVKTAKTLGITIPQSILLRANELIE